MSEAEKKKTGISNRQRRLKGKRTPKAGRKVACPDVVVAKPKAEPRGEAVRAALMAEVREREALRHDGNPRKLASFDRGGFIRASNRDGLASLHRSGSLTDGQAKAGLAFRLCYQASLSGLGSCLGKAGEGTGGGRISGLASSAAELHRAYLLARLNQMERAVGAALVDGRELHALRLIGGDGKTVHELAGNSGHARDAYKAALVRALDAIATALRITGN
jgi:hypothetical protein